MKTKLLAAFLIIALFIGCIPFLSSTSFGTPLFAKFLGWHLKGEVQLKKATLSWMGPQRFEGVLFTNHHLVANIGFFESKIPFWRLSHLGKSFTLQNGTFAFPSYENQKILDVQASLQENHITASGTTTQGGSFSIDGALKSKQDFDITANLRSIPTIAIDQLLKLHGILYKSLGSTLDFNGSLAFIQNRGALTLTLTSPNGALFLDGSILNNILTLQKPLTSSLRVSKELLKEIIPQKLFTDLSADNPFYLTISPQGFSCPINPFSLHDLQIGAATLDLGKLHGQSGESLTPLIQLFKNKEVEKTISLWFTPVAFRLQNGLIQLGRMDALLAQSIHLCTWGEINLLKDKLQMTLGIPADTLEKSFGIQNLSRNYVLKIPVKGSFQNPEFDTGPAIAKIGMFKTTQHIPTKGGKIFGKVVNVFTQQDDGDVPPPHRPFPWEK